MRLLGVVVAALVWPGMLIEVDVTASDPDATAAAADVRAQPTSRTLELLARSRLRDSTKTA